MSELLDLLDGILRRVLFLPEQASTMAREVDTLQYVEVACFAAIIAVTAGAGFWFLFRYRRREGRATRATPRVEAGLAFELGTAGGMLALFLAFWFVSFRQYVRETVPPSGAVEVYVTGKQWMWKFASVEGPASAGILYVPAGRPVKLLITSRDVIHSFYVPDFRIKRDAVPGRYGTIWFEAPEPGVHRILCAELCGTGHSLMRAAVVVLAPDAYAAWQRGEPPEDLAALDVQITPEPEAAGTEVAGDLLALGERVAVREGCLACHTVSVANPDAPHIGPTWVGLLGSVQSMQDGERVLADAAYVTQSMMDPAARITAGYPNVMPSYQGRITPGETAAILEYLRSLAIAPGAVTRNAGGTQ